MAWLIIIFIVTAILGLFLIDYSLIGFLQRALKIWPALSELDAQDVLVEDKTSRFSIHTDIKIKGKSGEDIIHSYEKTTLTVLLTKKHLIIKNTYLTYLLALNCDSITSFAIKKHLIFKIIVLYLNINNEKKYFEFIPGNIDLLIKEFSRIGLRKKRENVGPDVD